MKILSRIKVIDMTEGVAGPYASTILGDMGANVIKIERPDGDWGRSSGKKRGYDGDLNSQFIALNRNKRDLGLDLNKNEGHVILSRLLKNADVIISNYRPGVMKRFNLSYEDCRKISPNITYCTISGFGQKGEISHLPASDTVVQSISGMMDMIGDRDGQPLRISFPLIDMFAANNAVQAILLSLYSKKNEEKGAKIDISLMNTALAMMANPLSEYLIEGRLPQRHGNQNPSLSPAGSFQTADGKYITIAVLRESHWEKLCYAIDHSHLISDDYFNTNMKRLENREKLNQLLESVFKTKSSSEWIQKLQSADVLSAPLNNFEDIIKDHQFTSTMPLIEFNLPTETVRVIGNPISYNEKFFSADIHPPQKGEHTTEILSEEGYSSLQIKDLYNKGIVFGTD
ncbi:CoA transferase [Cytobacillus depressus]|uniref:CoA transferase n=1 Tax=Cytobacillus depressus TaxID=1602942 RepID=A0A6L3V526_9BACI|nr:CoA transferase [Cytobacillus depressus]KAB2336214.1 CoA transferase [Cytobacillus depressus]